MVHPLIEHTQTDERREKRLNSLEQRATEVENKLLRASNSALEKRVAELEASLKESNEECNRLRQTIAHMDSSKKDVIQHDSSSIVCKENDNNDNDNDDDIIEGSSITTFNNKEEEIIYERILKLIDNMKSDCQKAINAKIPTESQLPTFHGSLKSSTSKPPSPTDGLISPSKMMIGRSRTPSIGIASSNIPISRAGTPSGTISPPNQMSNSFIPTIPKSPSPPNKFSHLPSRSNTAPLNFANNIPVTSLNKQRARAGSCCSTNIPSRPSSPSPSSLHHTSIPSASGVRIPQKIQYHRQQVTSC